MKKLDLKNKDYLFIWVKLIFGNFRTTKRLIVFLFNHFDIIDLRKNNSKDFSDYDLLKAFEEKYAIRIKKEDIRKATNLNSNKTFNDHFVTYFKKNNLIGRKTFTPTEVFDIFKFWQGDGKWYRNEAFTKDELKDIFTNGDYKELAKELEKLLAKEENNIVKNKIPPYFLKLFISHIDFTDSEIIEEHFIL
jgi:hypothetical protein